MKAIDLKSLWVRGRRSAMLPGILGTGFRVGANLFLLPLVLMKLSRPEFAMWCDFLALGSFAFLADFGFGPAISRVYCYLWAGAADFETEGVPTRQGDGRPNYERLRQLNSTVRYLYGRLSLIGVSLVAVGGTWFLLKSISESDAPVKLWFYWAAFLLIMGYNLMTSHWLLACQGLDRMRELQSAYLFSSLAYVATASLLLLRGWGLASLILATLVRAGVMHLYCRHIYFQVVPRVKEKTEPCLQMVQRLWPNACKFGIASVGAYFLGNVHVLIATRLLGPDVTASVGLTVQVGGFLMNFAALWLGVKWPQITILRTQHRLDEMSVLFAQRLGLVMLTYLGLALFVLLAGNSLLEWKGTHTRLLAAPYLIFYFLYLAQNVFYAQFGSLAHTENVVPFFRIAICTGVSALIVSYVLTRFFGLWGLLVGILRDRIEL